MTHVAPSPRPSHDPAAPPARVQEALAPTVLMARPAPPTPPRPARSAGRTGQPGSRRRATLRPLLTALPGLVLLGIALLAGWGLYLRATAPETGRSEGPTIAADLGTTAPEALPPPSDDPPPQPIIAGMWQLRINSRELRTSIAFPPRFVFGPPRPRLPPAATALPGATIPAQPVIEAAPAPAGTLSVTILYPVGDPNSARTASALAAHLTRAWGYPDVGLRPIVAEGGSPEVRVYHTEDGGAGRLLRRAVAGWLQVETGFQSLAGGGVPQRTAEVRLPAGLPPR